MEHIEVMERKKVSKNCSTCLYCGGNRVHCGNANNNGQLMLLVNGGNACGWYWLDQHRYQRVN